MQGWTQAGVFLVCLHPVFSAQCAEKMAAEGSLSGQCMCWVAESRTGLPVSSRVTCGRTDLEPMGWQAAPSVTCPPIPTQALSRQREAADPETQKRRDLQVP